VLVGVNDDTCYNCGRRNPGLWGYAPALRSLGHDLGFVPFVIGTCIVMYGASLLVTIMLGRRLGMGGLFTMLSPDSVALFLLGESGYVPILQAGRWWTVLSAAWLHGGLLHIFMNMMALRQLAPAIAELYGPGRMVIIYTTGSVVGFSLSSLSVLVLPAIPLLQASPFTVGASASISGLLGAMLAYGHRSGSSAARGFAMRSVVMLVMIGFLPGIDNYAHLGGFGGGYLMAKMLDPLRPERVDHIAIAVACLVASMLAIVVSVVHGLQFVG
jgi:rhomboid protease GluP